MGPSTQIIQELFGGYSFSQSVYAPAARDPTWGPTAARALKREVQIAGRQPQQGATASGIHGHTDSIQHELLYVPFATATAPGL